MDVHEDFPLSIQKPLVLCSRIFPFIKNLQIAVKKAELPKQLRPAQFSISVGIHQIVENDFLRPVADIVHISHPDHGGGGFQRLVHTLPLGNLGDEIFHPLIAGGIDLVEMPEKFFGKDKPCPYAGAVFFQIPLTLLYRPI